MQIAFEALAPFTNAMLMGDFNFDSSWIKEQANIDKSYDDVYLTLNEGVEGFTMAKTPRFPAWRPDKILIKKESKWQTKQINIIGRFPIPSFAG